MTRASSKGGLLFGAAAGLGAAAVIVLFACIAYTPTLIIHVKNDTRRSVTLALCGSDPQSVDPGQTADIDPS